MRRLAFLPIVVAVAVLLASRGSLVAAPADVTNAFDAANRLYEQGQYADAIAAYEKLVPSASSAPALHFNLGNAFFKSGQTGRAIAEYRFAEKLSPRDPELRANLQFARNQIQGPTFRPGRWERLLGQLTLNEWAMASAICVWITFGLLTAMQLWPKSRLVLRGWTLLVACGTVLVGGLAACALAHEKADKTALVTTDNATIRTGPFEESHSSFEAHDGAELRVLDEKGGWLQVTDGNQRVGWVKSGDVVLNVRP